MKKWIWVLGAAMAFLVAMPSEALAGAFEITGGFFFNQSNYGNSSFSWTRRWTGSIGYHFSEVSEVELSFADVVNRTLITNYEDTTFHDQISSINWVQSVFGKEAIFNPYAKIGIGQLNRDATGSYAFGGSPTSRVDALTAILGAGARVRIGPRFGIRLEADTYLTGGAIGTWQDNISFNVGFSFYF